jgi:MATE family multidrug resistance protein
LFARELKKTVQLSVPIVVGQLGQLLMSVVDNIMVGKVGTEALAAAAIANVLFTLVMVVGFGVSMAITPLTAISFGRGEYKTCGVILRQGLILNLFSGFFLCGLTIVLSECIRFLNQPMEIIAPSALYMKVLGLSIIPMMVFQSYRQFAEGLSFLQPAMVITLFANIVNVFVNWVFIYGNLGAPALGLTGAGLATIASRVFMALVLMSVVMNAQSLKRFDPTLKYRKIDFAIMKKLLSIGIPGGFQYFFEVSAFAASSVMIGWIGANELAAHQIALNLSSISFMVAMGISAASTIRVGNAFGKNDIQGVRAAGFAAVFLCAMFMASAGLIFILFRNVLPGFYISENSVIEIASILLIIVSIFQISDGTQAVGLGILRGITDMKIPTYFTLTAYWLLGLPSGYILAFKFNMGVRGVWYGLLISLTISAILMILRFYYKSKQPAADGLTGLAR